MRWKAAQIGVMPVHLPPVTRREFLRRSLLAGAGFLTATAPWAAPRAPDPHTWALMADIHIAAKRTELRRGIVMAWHLEQAISELLAGPRVPAGVIVAGDLALNRGERGDYATLLELLQPLRAEQVSAHLAMGNHDHRENFLTAFPETLVRERPLTPHLVGIVRALRANWFILDSLEQTLATPGLLGAAQLAWLERALDAHQNRPALVVLHHHLSTKQGGALKDTQALLEVLRPRRQVKACIFGHTHVWGIKEDESGIHLINLPPVSYVSHPSHPNGWVQAELERRGMKLQLRCVDPEHPAHQQTVSLRWRKG